MTMQKSVIGHVVGSVINPLQGPLKPKSTGWFTASKTYGASTPADPPELLEQDYVDGGLIRVRWEDLQLTEGGAWDFTVINTQVAIHEANNKPFNLLVADSFNAPDWVYAGATNRFQYTFQSVLRDTAVIWDSYYQTHKGNLVAELGRVYDSHPLLRTIYFTYAAMTNGAEFHWRISPFTDYTNLSGFTEEVHKQATRDIFDMYAAAFPTTHIAFDIHAVNSSDVWAQQLYDYAYSKVGTQVGVAMWWLKSKEAINNGGSQSEAGMWTIALQAHGQGSFLIGQMTKSFLTDADKYDYVDPVTTWTSEEAFDNEYTFFKSGAVNATYNPHGIIVDCIESWPRDMEDAGLVALYDYPRG